MTLKTQVTAECNPDGAGRHLANLSRRGPGLDEADLDTAIAHARAALAALFPVAGGGEGSPLVAEARALLSTLLEHRIDVAADRLGQHDPVAVAGIRADRDEAIAVTGALLYWLPPGDPAWPQAALALGRSATTATAIRGRRPSRLIPTTGAEVGAVADELVDTVADGLGDAEDDGLGDADGDAGGSALG